MSWGPLCFVSYCTIRGVLYSPTTSVPAGHSPPPPFHLEFLSCTLPQHPRSTLVQSRCWGVSGSGGADSLPFLQITPTSTKVGTTGSLTTRN